MNRTATIVAGVVAVAVVLGLAWWLSRASAPPPVVQAPPEPAAPAPPAPVAEAPIHHPLPPQEPASAAEIPTDAPGILAALFGKQAVARLFRVDDFDHRVVATVDNLGRATATPRLWPAKPTPGRFAVHGGAGAETISPDNDFRYSAFLSLIENADMHHVASAYIRLYPDLQKAYVELGYPNGFFNDRLVEVVDLLLKTPEVDGGVRVNLPQINGPLQPTHPWLMYEFDDPALQSLTAGQKLLVRMGVVNERRVKTKLRELRALITTNAATR